MDFDPRGDDRFGSMKLAARTDLVSFPLKMVANFGSNNAGPMTNNMAAGGGVSLVRSNSMAGQPDNNNNNGRALGAGGAGCSPTTSSTTSDGCALLGNDGSYANMQHEQQEAAAMRSYIMSSSSCGRSMNAEALAMASYMGNAQRAMGLYNQGHGANYMMMAAGGGVVHDGDLMAQAANIFTASQLRELQLHALIFKHLMCGVNVPPELSLPIRTSVAASLGWGHFHLGYGGNSFDPEPGRCRRTDGKKWRCSRDVVPDQKYCERHMHRGRHRARKLAPEAGQLGANTNTAATNSTASVNPSSTTGMPNSSMPSGIPCASGGGGASRSGGGQLPPVSGHSTPGTPLRHATTSSFINPGGGGGGGGHQMSGHATGGSGGALSIASATAASFPNQPHHHHHQFGGGGTSTTTPPPSTRPDLRSYVCGTDLGSQEPGTFFSDARGLSLESPSSLSSGMSGSAAGAINEPSLMMRSVLQSKQQQQQQQEQAQSFLGAFDDNSAGGRESDQAGQPLRHFFDDWPRSRPDTASSTGLAWPADDDDDGVMDPSLVDDDNDHHRAHRGSSSTTQLSISMPIGCQVDRFGGSGAASPSNGSSPRGKLAGPALKLSMMSSSSSNASGQATGGPGDQLEAAATHMGLGVGTLQANEEEVAAAIIQHEQPRSEEGVFLAGRPGAAMSWVPIAWGGRNHHHHHHDHHNSGNSGAGGPLAEALHNSSNNSTPRGQPASTKNQNHHHNGGGAGSSGAPLNLMGGGPTGRTEQGGWHTDNCTTTSPTAPGQMQYSTSRAPGSGSGSGLAPGSGSGSGSASPRHHRR